MSATDEELKYVKDNEMDHVTYILIAFRSVTFFPLFTIADRHAPHLSVLHSSCKHLSSSWSTSTRTSAWITQKQGLISMEPLLKC